jgi:hypothetical protein
MVGEKRVAESEAKFLARKPYSRPAIVHSERSEARAVLCNKGPGTCKGPAHS